MPATNLRQTGAPVRIDCQDCGACCVNPRENQREGRTDYVPVEPRARLLSRRDLVRKFVSAEANHGPHLRLLSSGRCAALRGAPGRRVRCAIYHVRPKACRTVQPGDADCQRARGEQLMHP
jgi:Fe-S-cluster containining protein